jgi:hypothetical protein
MASGAGIVFECLRRGHNLPPRKYFPQRLAPFRQTRLAVVDFLSTSDKSDKNRPVLVAIHDREHRFRL